MLTHVKGPRSPHRQHSFTNAAASSGLGGFGSGAGAAGLPAVAAGLTNNHSTGCHSHTPRFAEASKVMAANQGLYNGFLAAGLVYGLVRDDFGATVLFTVFVIVAGVYGAVTASRRILFVQVVPGALALAAVLLAG